MRIICIIPARLGSYRFMEKPFADICGKPMIEHVYKRASLCKMLDEVYVATPNQEIVDVVEGFGGKAIMTS
ncbi:MAG: NTP transferase domain-containing protein, partial [Cyclobacteriaceae bacterium]|nr:NTP transferase domain-containing protein [Cyclobacteriaceae bacterium]